MRFTVTPLGGSGRSPAQIVGDIVAYLLADDQPSETPPREPVTGQADAKDVPAEGGGADQYYADTGEEPGRWMGKGALGLGLSGQVDREDFARVLAGRDPRTGERLITARGSAGRRPPLGVGTETRWGAAGEPLYDETDAAAVLDVPPAQVSQLLDAGSRAAAARIFAALAASAAGGTASREAPPGTNPGLPGGTFLVPVVDADGRRWVTETELTRCEDARAIGTRPEQVTAIGNLEDLIPLADAARMAAVTPRYLRSLAQHYETNRHTINDQLAAGRQPRRAYLVAQRGTKGRWFVTRGDLADFLARRHPPPVRVGYDVTLTTEKSLSVLAVLADPATGGQVLDAIQSGNDWALRWLEAHAALCRVKGKAIAVEGWTAASFRHHTSRALDPFIHHHNVVPNTVAAPDGQRRALDARGLYRYAKAAGALATAQMRWELTSAIGVRWQPSPHGGWEIAGIPEELRSDFSQRRSEVEEALRELEATIGRGARPDEVERVVLDTRQPKRHAPAHELRASWWQRARALGFGPANLAACVGQPPPAPPPDPQVLYDRLAAPDGLCQHVSVFNLGDVLAALCDMPIPQPDDRDPQPLIVPAERLELLADGFLRSPLAVQLTGGDDQAPPLFTTREMLAVQDRIVARYRSGLRRRDAAVVPADLLAAALASHQHLNGEQRGLVKHFCRSGHRTSCGIGRAGAGKTTAMAAASQAWQAAGYRVVGAAVKGEAARILGSATGIPTETLAWWLAHDDPHTAPLDARTVLIVDEASTISDRDLDQLGWLAEQTGTTLRLIGDPAQHSAVEAGGMFRVLCERHPRHTPQLKLSLRVLDPHDRAAAEALRQGKVYEALDHLDAAGHLHIVDDELDLYRQVLSRWWDAHTAGLDHPMVDRRNIVRHQLNRLAHRLLQANGEVGAEELPAAGDRRYATGDRVIARAPARHLHPSGQRRAYVRNGATGTVTAIWRAPRPEDDTITVAFDDIGTIVLPRTFFDEHPDANGRIDVGLDHAYAVTSYAVQGGTWGVSTSRIDDNSRRSEAYVDITRGTQANYLYLTRSADPLDGEQLPKAPPPAIDEAVARRLEHSLGEITAWEVINQATETQPERHTDAIGL